jgi:hypothetical protein
VGHPLLYEHKAQLLFFSVSNLNRLYQEWYSFQLNVPFIDKIGLNKSKDWFCRDY